MRETQEDVYIKNEEYELEKLKEHLNVLKAKWFKWSSTSRIIKFLEFYCKTKENFIKTLKKKYKETKNKTQK